MVIHRSWGFTLIEVLVVVAVIAILAGIAAPSFSTMSKNNRLVTETNDLMTDLAYARAEASRRGRRVTVCLSTDGASCGAGTAWGVGRIVFVDQGTTGQVDVGDTIVRVKQAESSLVTIVGSGSIQNFVQFRPDGAIGVNMVGQFKICDDRTGNFGRVIQVGVTGRAMTTTAAGSYASC